MTIVLALIIGVAAGVLSGVMGIGGGILIIPALAMIFHMTQHEAQGTSLVALLLPVGLLAVWKYYQAGNADLKIGLLIAVGFFFGAYFGAVLAQQFSDETLKKIFAVFLVIIAAKMFFDK